jgi:YbbR domain-containing protein
LAKRRKRKGNLRYFVFAVVISMVMWGIAHTSSTVERGFDIPLVFEDLPDDLVITEQSDAELNIRLQGSRAAMRNFSPSQLEYVVNVSGAKPGTTVHEVEVARFDLPRGLRIVSRSPSQIDARLERRGRKNVRIRPELEGEPAEGFRVGAIEVEPQRIWLTGARSRVLRLMEAPTETIDVSGLSAPVEREVRLSPGVDHVWQEGKEPIKVRIAIEPVAGAPVAGDAAAEGGA